MNDFASTPTHLNAVAPGKIPRSNMCPTLVCKDNTPYIILGSPGSERIPSAVLQTISNVIDHGMDLASAVAAPRLHWQDGTLHLEDGIAPEVAAQLQRRGHTVQCYARKERHWRRTCDSYRPADRHTHGVPPIHGAMARPWAIDWYHFVRMIYTPSHSGGGGAT